MRGVRASLPLVLVLVLVLAGLAGCSADDETRLPGTGPEAVRLAVVGDSITAADSPDLAGGELGRGSWVWHAVGEEITFAGGWAQWGATTEQMAVAVPELDADVLVILAGTNDAGAGVPFAQTARNIEAIVANAGVDEVALSAVPPIDAAPQNAVELNADIEELAAAHDWTWVPHPSALAEDGEFAPGMANDGLHPTEAGARLIGEAIATAVLTAAR
ncbi:SGNH/GDSL hydrolase family protein [Georgenia sunbinii]|uniref:SGNH/GDSL hydrolase family protein n=1 Tax=Georgenia sunbinii TaxID=3117728 RepID=UPI002F263C69